MTPAGLIEAMQTAIENEDWERALETSHSILFAKLFPQQKRDVFSLLCKIIEPASEATRIAAVQKCRELLPSFGDQPTQSWAESFLSSTIANIPTEPAAATREEPEPTEEPEQLWEQPDETVQSGPEPISATVLENIRRRRDLLQNLIEDHEALNRCAIPFGIGEELVEHSDRVWFLSEAYEGARLCIVAPEGHFMAEGLKELPLGQSISILRLEESWLLPVPSDPKERYETLEGVVASMTELLEEIVRSGNPIRCGSCGGELPPISKFCLHCGAAL